MSGDLEGFLDFHRSLHTKTEVLFR